MGVLVVKEAETNIEDLAFEIRQTVANDRKAHDYSTTRLLNDSTVFFGKEV
jgi:hypothetical protein